MADNIKIEGLNALIRNLKKAHPELVDKLKATNAELARDVEGVAKGLVPTRTGKLGASIRSSGTARSGIIRAGKKAVPYAGVIHFGWPAHRIAPQSFLYDALDSRRVDVERKYLDAVQSIVDEVNRV